MALGTNNPPIVTEVVLHSRIRDWNTDRVIRQPGTD